MNEKVKLPKDVCDALDSITTYAEDSEIVHLVYTGTCVTWDTKRLSQVTPNTIMQALVIGYEPYITPEEQIKELWKQQEKVCDFANGIREGIRQTLLIHGIKYDWLEGDAK